MSSAAPAATTARIIAFAGPAGSGKDTAANILCDTYGFERRSFAASLKDALAAIFKWPREDLNGLTPAAREWRERPDQWWTARLGFPVSPRGMMQQWGTELARNKFHGDIWIASLERELGAATADPIVVTDCRFENEATMIRNLGGTIVHIHGRGTPGTHASEASIRIDPSDVVIQNTGTIADFTQQVHAYYRSRLASLSSLH